MQHPREFVGIVVAVAATAIIFINALFLQHGPHPAPIFSTRPLTHAAAPVPQSGAELVTDIQRALARKGFYTDVVDGIWGSATDSAVRDFVQAAGLKIAPQASEELLRAIMASKVQAVPLPPPRNDPIARLLAPSPKLLAVQRALSDFGYGQIKPSGVYDAETRAAIEKFERERKLPVTGQASAAMVRELATVTGRPLE